MLIYIIYTNVNIYIHTISFFKFLKVKLSTVQKGIKYSQRKFVFLFLCVCGGAGRDSQYI